VSFKRNDIEDMELYQWLQKKSSKSGFIKDVLREVMELEINRRK
jgi:hypothetical protein